MVCNIYNFGNLYQPCTFLLQVRIPAYYHLTRLVRKKTFCFVPDRVICVNSAHTMVLVSVDSQQN